MLTFEIKKHFFTDDQQQIAVEIRTSNFLVENIAEGTLIIIIKSNLLFNSKGKK